MSATHTPFKLYHAHNGTLIYDSLGDVVASLEAGNQDKRDRDGAFIVRACNVYEEWHKALQELAELRGPTSASLARAIANAALKLAKEGR